MPNIYLRVPQYVAAFYRHRDDQHPLGEFDPVEFAAFTHEAIVIASSLILIDNPAEQSSLCYSQRVWHNILNGKPPTGGKKILQRDPKEWPSLQELCALHGRTFNDREPAFDYLCIKIPREIPFNGEIRKTSASYDEREKDSLRRMANRWFEKAMILPNDRLNFNSEFLHHVSEEEIEKEKRRRKRMKVKGGLKKI